jgi:rhamnose utilization protein RhaD (predicted bifunctional aldolase and dehydrogenase)/NAD(P)-dependent dehydrogenase (short-subunit alcohol dehydrogenase family)
MDPSLVMHGGGNTSVKDQCTNILGETEPVLFVKGSGWDLATIEKPGFAGVRLRHLLALRQLSSLNDVAMVNELRTHLISASAPDPSVEALLHAFLPHRFVDHTHADAVLTLTNQPNGERLVRELYGTELGIVPYVMPGFQLAKVCAEVFEKDPSVKGLILLRHGIFTFGETAKESYDRMMTFVQRAEEFVLSKVQRARPVQNRTIASEETSQSIQTIRREYLKRGFPCLLRLDASPEALNFVNDPKVSDFSQRGPLTPDHVIRTKQFPMLLQEGNPDQIAPALESYADRYRRYFAKHTEEKKIERQILDPWPRVVLWPGVGIITIGATAKDAKVAMDIYQHTTSVILNAEGMGGYEALEEGDLFDVEYWVLEQAKLKLGAKRLALTGKVALVTGGAGGIGLAIVKEFLGEGACVVILDARDEAFSSLEKELKPFAKGGNEFCFFRCDISQRSQVKEAVDKAVTTFGGLDLVVVNAGVFPKSQRLEQIDSADWQRSLDVNLSGALHTVAESLKWMKLQKAGGDLIFIASKNVPAPGKEAGAYSVAKAGQSQLARVAALEGGADGIRVNQLHPHLIFDTGIWTESVIAERAKSYGMTPEQYRTNNLLKTELTSRDVARAALALVTHFSKTTGAQISVDGGSDRTL